MAEKSVISFTDSRIVTLVTCVDAQEVLDTRPV